MYIYFYHYCRSIVYTIMVSCISDIFWQIRELYAIVVAEIMARDVFGAFGNANVTATTSDYDIKNVVHAGKLARCRLQDVCICYTQFQARLIALFDVAWGINVNSIEVQFLTD